jgi:hypothetical protein
MATVGNILTGLRRSLGTVYGVLGLTFLLEGAVGAQPSTPSNIVFYTVRHADLESVRDTVAGLLGTESQVLVDRGGGRLIVNTTAERHSLVEQLLKGLDVPLSNVRIEVRLKLRDRTRDRGGAIGGNGRSWPTGKGRTTEFEVKPRANDDRTEENEDIQQILLVESGREGSLRVGESIPYLDWLQEYGVNRSLCQRQILWQEVGAFLTVQPQVIGAGPFIRLRITPELRGLVDHNPLRVKYSTVTTEVTVQDGETVNLGGLGGNRDFYGRFLVGLDREKNERSLEITLTPHLVGGR